MSSRGVNKVILIGNVGNEPDIRYFPSGDGVANLSLATSDSWKDRNTGEPQERTEWHRVVIRGKLVEVVKQYVHKGSKLYLEGSLRTRKWQGQDGQDRYTTEIVVGGLGSSMQMLDSRGQGPNYDTNQRSYSSSSGNESNHDSLPSGPGSGGHPVNSLDDGGSFDDDIPF